MLDWFRDPALRRRVQPGLNKGEARNALAGTGRDQSLLELVPGRTHLAERGGQPDVVYPWKPAENAAAGRIM
ncbi:MAG: Tn3 transposase domain [Proteobacteria bacterium]|nr:Tn3 transposase domain [Pseudomonadota bacterium]